MASAATRKLELSIIDGLRRRAALANRTLDEEVSLLTAQRSVLSPEERLREASELRAMTPAGADSTDSTLLIRWDRDTGGGDYVDDGWRDDDRR
jgi:hypothetical protein